MYLKKRIEKLETNLGASGKGSLTYLFANGEDPAESRKRAIDSFIGTGGKEGDIAIFIAVCDYSWMPKKHKPTFQPITG